MSDRILRPSITPVPQGAVCPEHSGIHQRVKDLEGRAYSAATERRTMRDEITAIKMTLGRWGGIIAVLLVLVQIGTAVALKLL